MPEEKQQPTNTIREHLNDVVQKVVSKIDAAESILVALSKDPSVDDLAAAIGLTMLLDKAGKHATAIYSGATPNAIQFLEPEKTLEPNTNSLQDFIIALSKDKADHLRYKIEGDFVKVYITPYRSTLSEKDLAFEHGDFNVDLVVAIDVDNGDDLDTALAEYGRIMHDATAVNITNKAPGHFAEVDWSDQAASSVCEMVVKLAKAFGERMPAIEKEEATALLTGIVAATDKFSNKLTSPDVMAIAAELMTAGADQQLISSNIDKGGETEAPVAAVEAPVAEAATAEEADPGKLKVEHDEPEAVEPAAAEVLPEVNLATQATPPLPEPAEVPELPPMPSITEAPEPVVEPVAEPAAAVETIAPVIPVELPETPSVPEVSPEPTPTPSIDTMNIPAMEPVGVAVPQAAAQVAEMSAPVTESTPGNLAPLDEGPVDYGSMMDAALAQAAPAMPMPPTDGGVAPVVPPAVPPVAQTVPPAVPAVPTAPDLGSFQIPGAM